MDDQAPERQEWWAIAAICVHTLVLMNIAAVLLLERAELFRVDRGGALVGISTGWQYSLLVARFEALGAFILPPFTSVCALMMRPSARRTWAVWAASLLSVSHFVLLFCVLPSV